MFVAILLMATPALADAQGVFYSQKKDAIVQNFKANGSIELVSNGEPVTVHRASIGKYLICSTEDGHTTQLSPIDASLFGDKESVLAKCMDGVIFHTH